MSLTDYFMLQPVQTVARMTLKASYGGQQIRNVFWTIINNTWGTLSDEQKMVVLDAIAEHLITGLIENLRSFTTSGVGYTSWEATAPLPNSEGEWLEGLKLERTIGLNGAISNDGTSTFTAGGFRMSPISKSLMRSGFKRFVSIPEASSAFGIWTPTVAGEVNGVNNFINRQESLQSLSNSEGVTQYAFAIPHFQKVPQTGKYAIVGARRVYECLRMNQLRHQISRQRGRGI